MFPVGWPRGLELLLAQRGIGAARSPERKQVGVTDQHVRRIRIVRAPKHRAHPAIHQQGLPLRVEKKRRTVGHIAVEDEGGIATPFGDVVDGVSHGAGREHGLKAHQGDVRGDEKDGGGEGDADRGLEMVALPAEYPGDHRAHRSPAAASTAGKRARQRTAR